MFVSCLSKTFFWLVTFLCYFLFSFLLIVSFAFYAATDPAEFFAVVSELFFERPIELAAQHPALYGELRGFYRLDPAGW